MNTKYKVPFGLKDGILYEPSEVERGKLSNCKCPSCNKPLIARQGNKNIHHFAHATDNSCQSGRETAIHLAAKQIIHQKKAVYLPSIKIEDKSINYGLVTFDEIVLEKAISKEETEFLIIPDITAKHYRKNGDIVLYIEIAVTHFSEDKKISELKKKRLSSIEIDLSSLLNESNVNFKKIEEIIESGNKSTWLYNQKLEIENEKIKKRDADLRKKRKDSLDEKQKKKKALIKLYNDEIERKKNIIEHNNQLFNYAKQIMGIRHLAELPSFIMVSNDIDALYPIDGRLVRLYIYEHFILRRKNILELKERAFGAKAVISYLRSQKQLYPNKFFNDWYRLTRGDDGLFLDTQNNDTPNFNPKKIISNYLYLLREVNVLVYSGNYFFKLPSGNTSKNICNSCKKPLPLSAEYCKNCGVVQ